jgi:hypothetical protein
VIFPLGYLRQSAYMHRSDAYDMACDAADP